MRKKVCMIVQNKMVKGGIAAVVNGYRNSQLEKDYDITYVESYKDGGKLTKILKGICGYIHFAKVIIWDKPDLVHIHSSFGMSFYRSIPFIYMASWAKKPIINHIHGADFEEFYLNSSTKKRKKIKNIYNKCDTLIALSAQWKEYLSQIVPKEKITVIENYSVLHEDVSQQRLKRQCNNVVLFLGEIGHRKGCYDIPSVIEQVVKRVPTVKFIICGAGNDEDEKAIRNLVSDKKLEDYVKFPGWVRDVEKDTVLRNADVFFLPSYNEGMPMSILDAMGYGLPIVSTLVGGIPKIVRNGINGFCCEPGDINAFSEGIIKLLVDKKSREDAIKQSTCIVKHEYSFETHLKLLEQTYGNVG